MKKLDSLTLHQVMKISNVLLIAAVALLLLGGAVAEAGMTSGVWIAALCILAIILVIARAGAGLWLFALPPLRCIPVSERPRAHQIASLLSPMRQAAG